MFYQCLNLTDVSFVNQSILYPENMLGMFADCPSLVNINWGKVNTSKVTNMGALFTNCVSLESIDISALNTQSNTTLHHMFCGCSNLKNIIWGNTFSTANVKNVSYMFAYCTSIKELDLSCFDLSGFEPRGTNMMLYDCDRLEKVISPSKMGLAGIMFYVEDSLSNLFMWTEEGKNEECLYIPPKLSNAVTYVFDCRYEYWEEFINSPNFYRDKGNYYYISDVDYDRLISHLKPSDYLSVTGLNNINQSCNFYNSRIEKNESMTGFKPIDWQGSCYGMSSWVILQNKEWVRLQGKLNDMVFNDDIMSKINFYQFQQNIRRNIAYANMYSSLRSEDKVKTLIEQLKTDAPILVSYRYSKNSNAYAHAVVGLGLRDVIPGEETDKGRDVSDYTYCAIIYDPNTRNVSAFSDYNLYFNEDGSFYIPEIDIKGPTNRNYLKRVVCAESYINSVDYYSGETYLMKSDMNSNYIRLSKAGNYFIQVNDDYEVYIDKNGLLENDSSEIYVIPDDDVPEYAESYYTVVLPKANEYTISSDEGFYAQFLGEDFTSSAGLESAGKIIFKNNGDTFIVSDGETEKRIHIGINDGFKSIPWNYLYAYTEKGMELSLCISDDRVVAEGDNLADAVIRFSKEYEKNEDIIKLYDDTTRAEILKGSQGITVNQDGTGNDEDDKNDENDNEYTTDGYTVTFELADSWDNGYNGLIKIENTSDKVIDNWKLAFEYEDEISNIWNGVIEFHEDSRYIIKNAGYNQDIEPGKTVEIGISGQSVFNEEPQNYLIVGTEKINDSEDYDVTLNTMSDWGEGSTENITITNSSDVAIEDWILEFDYDGDIAEIWNADIISHEGNHYVIKNKSYSGNISAKSSISFGFNTIKTPDTEKPCNYVLKSME